MRLPAGGPIRPVSGTDACRLPGAGDGAETDADRIPDIPGGVETEVLAIAPEGGTGYTDRYRALTGDFYLKM